jgi:hypothetical protein
MLEYSYFICILLIVILFLSFISSTLEFFCGRDFLNPPSFEDRLGLHPWLFFDNVNMDRWFVRMG